MELRAVGLQGQFSEVDDREIRRVMGRIGRLIACGHPDGQRLKSRVRALLMSAPLLDRYMGSDEVPAVIPASSDELVATKSAASEDLDLPWDVDEPSLACKQRSQGSEA